MSNDAEKRELPQEREPAVFIRPDQEFTHVVESVLDRVRDGIVPIDETLIALLRDCGEHIGSVLDRSAQAQTKAGAQAAVRAESLVARLQYYLARPGALPDLAEVELGSTTTGRPGFTADTDCPPHSSYRLVRSSVGEVSAARQQEHGDGKAGAVQTVPVEADKLDRLIDLVGELTMASAAAGASRRGINDRALHEAHFTLTRVVQDVCDSVMQLRRVKIGATFERFRGIVHEVAREFGKDIELSFSGDEIELDKTLAEKIADSLAHLVLNSTEHGIESPAIRSAQGKPARGRISLNAYHDSGRIVIEVGDDGRGVDTDIIHAKAVEHGLAKPGEPLTEQEIERLISGLGFSTTDVTKLSGRGVGLDVVKRNITALHGAVSVHSRPGLGTTVVIRLPLAHAVINGFQVAVGGLVLALPLESVEECVELDPQTGHEFADLRGEVLPFIRLREIFRLPGASGAQQSIVVVRHDAQRFGLIVDRLLGEAQVVIKPLAKMSAHLTCVSGSSILGSGDVALILDVAALAAQAPASGAVPREPERPSPFPLSSPVEIGD